MENHFTSSNDFYQIGWKIENQYEQDNALKDYLNRVLPRQVFNQIEPDLRQFGQFVSIDLLSLIEEAEKNPPRLIQFDHFGKRIDQIITSHAWKTMGKISAKEGVIAIGFEKSSVIGSWRRLYQFSKLMLFAPNSCLYSCPLAMTDGAATLIRSLLPTTGGQSDLPHSTQQQMYEVYKGLTSRIPGQFMTSGQWMTEKGGGSDVGAGTRTVARLVKGTQGLYKLWGCKWFSSATDADVAITLARIEEDGKVIPGSRGLSCFLVKVRLPDGQLNNIEVIRLKNKLGTRQMPTAELQLKGTEAFLISPKGKGIRTISRLVNVTRLHNAVSSIGGMSRILILLKDYATKRIVFGKCLSEQLPHQTLMADMETEYRGCMQLTMDSIRIMGRVEEGIATADEILLLRLLVPLTKLYTGKQAVAIASECLEAFGGIGYVEDSGLPRMLRDAQVLSIWEGTTNVLAVHHLSVINKTKGKALAVFVKNVKIRCNNAKKNIKNEDCERKILFVDHIIKQVEHVHIFFTENIVNPSVLNGFCRSIAFAMSRIYAASCLLEQAVWSEKQIDWIVLEKWVVRSSHYAPFILPHCHLGSENIVRLKENELFATAKL